MANRALIAVAAVAVTSGLAIGGLSLAGQLPYGEPQPAERTFTPKAFVIDEAGFAVTGEAGFDACFRAAYGAAEDPGSCARHRLGERWIIPETMLTFGYQGGEYDLPADYYLKRQPL